MGEELLSFRRPTARWALFGALHFGLFCAGSERETVGNTEFLRRGMRRRPVGRRRAVWEESRASPGGARARRKLGYRLGQVSLVRAPSSRCKIASVESVGRA